MSGTQTHRIGYEDSFNLTTSLCLTYVLIVAIIRAWVRRGAYGEDDFVLLGAVIVSLGHFAANYLALDFGLGKPWAIIQEEGNVSALNAVRVPECEGLRYRWLS